MTAPAHHEARTSLLRLIAFSLPGAPIGALAVALAVYLPRYYAAHFALGLSSVGAAFMAVRLVDTGLDPLLGVLMDRTRTRIGRYRVWLVAGAPLLAASVLMLFAPPFAPGFAYLAAWLLIYYAAGSVVTLAHMAWSSLVATDYHARSRLFGTIQVVSVVAATVALLIPALTGDAGSARTMAAIGGFIAATAVIGVAVAALSTREAPTAQAETHERLGWRDYWALIARPDMARLLLGDACLTLGPQWMAASYLFYFHDARGFSDVQSSYLLAIYVACGIPGAALLSWAATRLGKHRTLMLAAGAFSAGLASVTLLPKADFAPAAALMALLGALYAAFVILVRAMTADVGDAVRLDIGRQRTGLLFAFLSSTEKVANALSIGLTFSVLALVGYDAREGAANGPGAIRGLEIVFLAGPIGFVALGALCFLGYRLDGARHAAIRLALEARDGAVGGGG